MTRKKERKEERKKRPETEAKPKPIRETRSLYNGRREFVRRLALKYAPRHKRVGGRGDQRVERERARPKPGGKNMFTPTAGRPACGNGEEKKWKE